MALAEELSLLPIPTASGSLQPRVTPVLGNLDSFSGSVGKHAGVHASPQAQTHTHK